MGPGVERITAGHRRRFQAMVQLGCVVSRVWFHKPETPGEVHHVLSGGRRLGHDRTIYLHPWYHRGVPPMVRHAGELRQLTQDQATSRYGPSLALDRPAFERRFAAETDLLEMQDALLSSFLKMVEVSHGTA